eukprot:Sspe_Gene.116735::Locus_106422_Transcript_1_1_Confidence_1.000_Length_998::g.116735::m.116735
MPLEADDDELCFVMDFRQLEKSGHEEKSRLLPDPWETDYLKEARDSTSPARSFNFSPAPGYSPRPSEGMVSPGADGYLFDEQEQLVNDYHESDEDSDDNVTKVVP